MAVVSVGNGIAVPAVISQVLARIPPALAGAASGVLTTAQQFASALGIAVIGGIFFHVLGHGLAGFGHALGTAVWYELGLVLIGIALSVLLGRLAHR